MLSHPVRSIKIAILAIAPLVTTAFGQLQWDPHGAPAGAQGDSGDWLTSNGGVPWWNGATNVSWSSGSDASFGGLGGTVTVSGVTVDDMFFTPGAGTYTISGDLTLGLGEGTHDLTVESAVVISAVLSGTEGFVKLGASTLTLSRANTYSGPTTVSAGTLSLGAAGVIPDSSVLSIAAGATVTTNYAETVAALTGAGSVSLSSGSAALAVGGNNDSTTFSGTISGSGGLIKNGTGTLTLTGSNTFSGTTTINNGTIEASGGSAIADTSTVAIGASGSLRLLDHETVRALSGVGTVDLGSKTLKLTPAANGGSFAGTISGSGSVAYSSAFKFTLSGANSFTGGIVVDGGGFVLVPDLGEVGVDGPLGAGAVTLGSATSAGGIAPSVSGTFTTNRPISIAAGGANLGGSVPNFTNGTIILNGVLSGPGGVNIFSGTVALTNSANSFSGGIQVSSSAVLAVNDVPDNTPTSPLGAAGPITLGGTLRYTGTTDDSSDRTIILGGSGTIEVPAAVTLSLAHQTGTGGLVKIGAGTLVQTDSTNDFTGPVTVGGGVLRAETLADSGVASGLGAGSSIQFKGGGELAIASGITATTHRSLSFTSGGGRIRISNSVITLAGTISGDQIGFAGSNASTDTFIVTGTTSGSIGSVTIDAANVQWSPTAIGTVNFVPNTGASLQFANASTMGGLNGGAGPNYSVVTMSTGLTIGGDGAFDGILAGNGTLTKTGPGVQTLSGPSTFTGGVIVQAGGLALSNIANSGIASSLGSGSTVELGSTQNIPAPQLIYTGSVTSSSNRALLIGETGGWINVVNANVLLGWTGSISGGAVSPRGEPTSLVKKGAGTLRLSGANGFSGATQISEGKLQVIGGNALPNGGTVQVDSGAVFELLAGTNEVIGALSGAGDVLLGGQRLSVGSNDGSASFTGTISGGGGSQIEKQGSGTFTLTNANNSFAGGLLVSDGAVSAPMIADAGFTSPIGSSGTITLGDSVHTGRLILTAAGSSSTNRPFSFAPGGGIIEVGTNAAELVLSGPVTGTGSFLKFGAGRLVLLGDKAYSGSSIVADGTLRLRGSIPNSNVTVYNPASLDSVGLGPWTMGALTIAGGELSPGGTGLTDAFNVAGLTLSSGTVSVDLNSASDYDRLSTSGSVEFDGLITLKLQLNFDPEDFVDVFRLVSNDGTGVTTLNGPAARFIYNGFVLNDGQQFLVTSGDFSQLVEIRYGLTAVDNDVRLIVVPEPNALSIVCFAGLAISLVWRRRPMPISVTD